MGQRTRSRADRAGFTERPTGRRPGSDERAGTDQDERHSTLRKSTDRLAASKTRSTQDDLRHNRDTPNCQGSSNPSCGRLQEYLRCYGHRSNRYQLRRNPVLPLLRLQQSHHSPDLPRNQPGLRHGPYAPSELRLAAAFQGSRLSGHTRPVPVAWLIDRYHSAARGSPLYFCRGSTRAWDFEKIRRNVRIENTQSLRLIGVWG